MKNITLSIKAILLAFSVAAICTTTYAKTGQACVKGGYIKRVMQGWPHTNNVIGITIVDEYGNESHWTTEGSGDVNDHAWTRSLLAMALTAYTNQTYVYPSTGYGQCHDLARLGDGNDWHRHWEGLIFAKSRGSY